jgi:hypothetical protein
LAQLVRRWKDDPAPPLPEEAELPDREATRKHLETLLAWEQRILERFEQENASALDTPDELLAELKSPTPRTVQNILGWLEAKRTKLLAEIAAAEKGPRGGGRPRGFRADTQEKSLAWIQGQVDADFLLPELRPYHQALQFLGVANLPQWTGEPQDETGTLDLLNRMIFACQSGLAPPRQPPDDPMRFEKLTPKQREFMRFFDGRNGEEVSIHDAMKAVGKKPVSPRERKSFLASIRRLNERLATHYLHLEIELDRKAKTIKLVKT